MSTLAELNQARVLAEHAIAQHNLVPLVGATDVEFADWYQRAYVLHERLVSVLEETERVAWREAPYVAGALRWAVTGARLRGEHYRDNGIKWLKMAASS